MSSRSDRGKDTIDERASWAFVAADVRHLGQPRGWFVNSPAAGKGISLRKLPCSMQGSANLSIPALPVFVPLVCIRPLPLGKLIDGGCRSVVDCSLRMRKVPGSIPGISNFWHSVH